MIKKMKLKGEVTLKNGELIFSSTHYDGTPFSIKTTESDLQLKNPLLGDSDTVDCVLYVMLEGQQDSRCYLTLPQSSIHFGRQVTVNRGQLLIHNAPFGLPEVVNPNLEPKKIKK